MGFELVGKVWDAVSFKTYIQEVNLSWANSVTIHHTASPSLAQRPQGFKIQHMRNLAHYYGNQLGWSAGPHIFVDEDEYFGLSSLYRRGVHAVSFNSNSIGIEMLGQYDDLDDPKTGRGLDVVMNTAELVSILLTKMKLKANDQTVKFHRDDPKTNKTCCGKLIEKYWFLDLVNGFMDTGANLTIEERLLRIERKIGLA